MFRHVVLLKSTSSFQNLARNKSAVIRQIETSKLSRAEKIKKQNFETAHLFGPKISSKKNAKVKSTTAINKTQQENVVDSNGISSEIFWTLSKSSATNLNNSNNSNKIEEDIGEKTVEKSKKIFREDETQLPETFARFKLDLPRPVKVTIKDALDNLDSHINNNAAVDSTKLLRDIPFDQNQLRRITEFPINSQNNDLMLEVFDKSEIMSRKINYTPSVSKILQATMLPSQKNALIQWKNLKIAELGLEGFEEMQKSYLSRGKLFHECLQTYFNNSEIKSDHVPLNIKELWKSVTHVLNEFELPATATEQAVFHPHLRYKGIVDCVSVHNVSNSLSAIEWKNSDRHKKSVANTFDAPVQLAAYIGALNLTHFQNNPLKSGIIVVAYNDGKSADLFHLTSNELNKYWKLWLNRLQDYWIRYRDNTLVEDEI